MFRVKTKAIQIPDSKVLIIFTFFVLKATYCFWLGQSLENDIYNKILLNGSTECRKIVKTISVW